MPLGARVASFRKEQDITQVHMTDLLKVSQQTITAYEVGRRRSRVSSHRFSIPWLSGPC